MKTKLLKKIRKRFIWYINSEGFPVIIDKKEKSFGTINLTSLKKYYNYTDDSWKDEIEIDIKEWAWRNLKQRMLKPFGFNITQIWYNKAIRLSRKRDRYKKD